MSMGAPSCRLEPSKSKLGVDATALSGNSEEIPDPLDLALQNGLEERLKVSTVI